MNNEFVIQKLHPVSYAIRDVWASPSREDIESLIVRTSENADIAEMTAIDIILKEIFAMRGLVASYWIIPDNALSYEKSCPCITEKSEWNWYNIQSLARAPEPSYVDANFLAGIKDNAICIL